MVGSLGCKSIEKVASTYFYRFSEEEMKLPIMVAKAARLLGVRALLAKSFVPGYAKFVVVSRMPNFESLVCEFLTKLIKRTSVNFTYDLLSRARLPVGLGFKRAIEWAALCCSIESSVPCCRSRIRTHEFLPLTMLTMNLQFICIAGFLYEWKPTLGKYYCHDLRSTLEVSKAQLHALVYK